MLSVDEVARRAVVNECFQACYRSRSPVNELATRVEALARRGWEEADVRHVELAVLRLLVGMMSDDKHLPDDTTVE
jgi:hypothetical protein